MNPDLLHIKKYVSHQRLRLIFFRIVDGLAPITCVFLATSILLNSFFAFYPWVVLPLIWDILTGAAILFLLGWIIDSLLIHAPDLLHVASLIERQGGPEHPLLSISLELADAGKKNSLVHQTYKTAASQLPHFQEIKRKTPVTLWLVMVMLPLWVVTFIKLEPSLTAFWNMPFLKVNSSSITITPGTVKIGRNESIELRMVPSGTLLPSCKIKISKAGEKHTENMQLRPDSSGIFKLKIDSIRHSFTYQFVYGGQEFKAESITVVPPPSLYSLQIRLYPPKYTGDTVATLPEGQGDIRVYAGTKVQFTIESDQLSSAFLITKNDSTSLDVKSSKATGEITVWKETAYTFGLVNTAGQKSDSIPEFYISIIPDDPPIVHFLKPGFNTSLKPEQVETLWVEGIDDLGIRSLEIQSCRNGECNDAVSTWNISPKGTPKITRQQVEWNLRKYSLYPGDTLFYWAKIRDTKPSGKGNVNQSDTFWFRVPSFEEIHKSIVEEESAAEEKIENVRSRQNSLQEMVEQLVKGVNNNKELTWDQKQIVEDVQKAIQAQSDSLQSALKSLEENVEKIKQQGETGDELLQKMEQVQKELKELMKEFGDSLFRNKKNNEQVSFDEMKQAIEKLQKVLPELNERLDNTLKFLEMLRKERDMAVMAMRAERLAQDQASLAQEKPSSRTMNQQKDLLSRIDEFNKDLKQKHSSSDDLSSTSEKIASQQHQMKSELSDGKSPSTEQMNNMSASLLSASQQLRDMMSSTKAQRMQKEQKLIMEMVENAMTLSEWQELIIKSVGHQDSKDVALSQQALSDALKSVFQKTDSLKTTPPLFKNSINKEFANAIEHSMSAVMALGDGNGQWAMRENKFALNSLSSTLLDVIRSMKQQGQGQMQSGGGLMDALRNLSGKQASINSATTDLLRSLLQGSGDSQSEQQGSSPGAGNDAARKAAQEAQKALANELKKLAQKYGKEAGSSMSSRLEELEKEAQRIAKMLEQPQPEVAQHQQRFLSRMLQTTLSMNRQDEGKEERVSKAAESVFSVNDDAKRGAITDDPDTFYKLRTKALMGNFPESYREAIKEYFDSLEVMFLKK